MKIAYIPLKWDNIRNADMNKLYAMPHKMAQEV